MCAQCKHARPWLCLCLCLSFRLKAILANDERWVEICAKNTKGPVVSHRALMLFSKLSGLLLEGACPELVEGLVHPLHAVAVSATRHSRFFLFLGEFGDHDLGGEHQTRDAGGVL